VHQALGMNSAQAMLADPRLRDAFAGDNAHFAWFGTTGSKSRLNFLALLRAGYDDYVINAEALAYMRERALAAHVIARLIEHPERCFAGRNAWNAHLETLGIAALRINPDPVMVATEGALWGSVKAHGFLPNAVIVSDDAGQFNSLPPRRRIGVKKFLEVGIDL
jgi:hypothetical protein